MGLAGGIPATRVDEGNFAGGYRNENQNNGYRHHGEARSRAGSNETLLDMEVAVSGLSTRDRCFEVEMWSRNGSHMPWIHSLEANRCCH